MKKAFDHGYENDLAHIERHVVVVETFGYVGEGCQWWQRKQMDLAIEHYREMQLQRPGSQNKHLGYC
jgi:hypothetical protein